MDNVETRRLAMLRFLAEPSHVNFSGKVHGGIMMKWIDQAGYTCATAWSGCYCVTVYVGGVHFLKPILVGSVVELQARLIHTGRTSLHIAVDIYAGDPRQPKLERAGHCVIVFVALDAQSKPTEVPRWVPQDPYDRAMEGYALRLVELRRAMEEEMRASLHLMPDPAPQVPAGRGA